MANKAIKNIKDAAEKLYNVRREIETKEEEMRIDLAVLKSTRDGLQDYLIKRLNENGIASIKVAGGDTFVKAIRKGVEVVNETQAFDWAYKNKAVMISNTIVKQILKESREIPPCFKEVETEYISVRKAKE